MPHGASELGIESVNRPNRRATRSRGTRIEDSPQEYSYVLRSRASGSQLVTNRAIDLVPKLRLGIQSPKL